MSAVNFNSEFRSFSRQLRPEICRGTVTARTGGRPWLLAAEEKQADAPCSARRARLEWQAFSKSDLR